MRFEARLLLSRASNLTIEELISRGRDEAAPDTVAALRALTARRVLREPMAHILGEREFWGLPFVVTPDVLVPRPDSETVIEAALSLMPDRATPWTILDLGVGSGCLLLTLLREYPAAQGTGLDASSAALAVAQTNAERLGVAARARLLAGDWRQSNWTERFGGPFDLVISNPPYIASATIAGLMPEVARYEPLLALDGGADGLEAYRLIARAGRELVTTGGWLLAECGEGQASDISGIFAARGLRPEKPWKDLAGIDRVIPAKH